MNKRGKKEKVVVASIVMSVLGFCCAKNTYALPEILGGEALQLPNAIEKNAECDRALAGTTLRDVLFGNSQPASSLDIPIAYLLALYDVYSDKPDVYNWLWDYLDDSDIGIIGIA